MQSEDNRINIPEVYYGQDINISGDIDLSNPENWRKAQPIRFTAIPEIQNPEFRSNDFLDKEDKFLLDAYAGGGEVKIINDKLVYRGSDNRLTTIATIRNVKGEQRVYKSPFAKIFLKENTDELVENWAKENGYAVWKEDFGDSYARGGSLYEVNRVGENDKPLEESMMGAKNLNELKERINEKYGTTEGFRIKKRSKSGAFHRVNFNEGGSTKPNPTEKIKHNNLMSRTDYTAYVKINDYPYTATVRKLSAFKEYLNRKDEKFTPNVFGEICYISDYASKDWIYELKKIIVDKKKEMENKMEIGGELSEVADMLPHSEPMGVIEPINIMETIQPMYAEGGGAIIENQYDLVVNDWVYFTFNYPSRFWDVAFGNDEHIKGKFSSIYERVGSLGVMPRFWSELDGGNRLKLVRYIKANYVNDRSVSGKIKKISDNEYVSIVNHWTMFGFNYPTNFIEKAFANNMPQHFEGKFSTAYDRAGSVGAVNKFYTELSRDNQEAFASWVMKNYSSKRYADGGGIEPKLNFGDFKETLQEYEIEGGSTYSNGGGVELTRGDIENKIQGLKLRIAKTKKEVSSYESTNRGKYNKLWQEKVVPLQKELDDLSELWGKSKYANGGGVKEQKQMSRTILNDTVHKLIKKNGTDIMKYSQFELSTLDSYVSHRDISEQLAETIWGLAIKNGFNGYMSRVLIINSGTGKILNYVNNDFSKVDAVNPSNDENIIATLLNNIQVIDIHSDSLKLLNHYDLGIIINKNNADLSNLKMVCTKLKSNNMLIFVAPMNILYGENPIKNFINEKFDLIQAFCDESTNSCISVLKKM